MGHRARLSVAVFSVAAVAAAMSGTAGASPGTSSSGARSAAITSASPAVATAATATRYTAGRYLVTFADEAVASYDGYVAGYPRTRPTRGHKLNPNSTAVQKWQGYLTAKHDRALAKVGATKIYDYTVANNGVAVRLSAQQAFKLSRLRGVVYLSKDQKTKPDTTESPHFLGLDAPGGIWSQLGGAAHAGAGLVVGVIDTGIWPESTAFAGNTGIPVPATWHGTCVSGEQFDKNLACNDKLIGARYYVTGFNKHNIAKAEYLSPRDGSGHGSHTSSTAAGNHGTEVRIDGNLVGFGSGMAPGAKVAMYKVCWEGKPGINPGCFNSDSVAAINDAVLDGVDVLNYSIGGSSESSVFDTVAQAFRGASNAGVYVANSAGNSGPGASTLDHPAPWVTTVAAATFRQAFQAVELGDAAHTRFVGASITPSLPTLTPFVTSLSAKLASASDANAKLCVAGTLDPAKVVGKVVQCDRGVVDRIEKSFEVRRAGGVAMVMTNTNANSLNADFHPIPSVHVSVDDRAPILAYITSAGAGARAKIVPLTAAELAVVPQVPEIAAFSSRGPSITTDGDILKPDIAAPGVDVVAAVAPPSNRGRSWDFYSGTSMSSPHMAGIGALIMAQHPNWLPSEIKSALMTSAGDTVSSADDPFAQGAGFVNPNGAADPGLVYPTTATEYRQYLVSLGAHFAPPNDTLEPIAASNLNQASIAIGKMAGTETVTRTVKNVGSAPATYTATVNVPGIDATVLQGGVEDNTVTLAPGASATFQVRFAEDSAALGDWAIGALTWTDGSHVVRSPIAIEPVAVSAPTEVHGDASASGSEDFDITLGSNEPLDLSMAGLVGVTPTADSVTVGEFDINNPVVDADTKKYTVNVPVGTKAARFSLDSGDNTADLDLFVYKDGDLVDLSASGSADEQVTIDDPADGDYDVYVNGFATPGGSTSYGLANFVVAPVDAGNVTLSPDPVPAPAVLGDPSTVTASWSGLDATKRWFGVISYAGADNLTYLSIG
jgi:subtilisin family serine protease